ncbi:MAG: DUF1343 domain-containing protein [Planctomycetaceae bacterium]|nr:DUF1343 domain-containing protein [Planctomycetaceae bacterium]
MKIVGLILLATCSLPAAADDVVLTGLDVLQRDHYRILHGQRVGLITNHTGCSVDGVSGVRLLAGSDAVKLTALFSPEHGLEGKLDIAKIDDSRDANTGLQIFSLYGTTRRPTADMLQAVDTLVFDIQDIGCRFYTYISTMGEAMRAAAEHGKRFVVLDRPNPINGIDIAGPMLDAGRESFVGFHALPVRHAMTIGEIAKMLKAELQLDLELTVVPCEGWQRHEFWDATGLTWINPSPNMRSLTQALLYPGIGLMETTNVSVGRGTDTPFEVLGAPWIDGRRLAAELNALNCQGVRFVPIRFTPESSKFQDRPCGGINIIVTDRETFHPLQTGFAIATSIRRLYPRDWEVDGYLRLLGNQKTFSAVVAGSVASEVQQTSTAGLDDFRRRRQLYLIYD